MAPPLNHFLGNFHDLFFAIYCLIPERLNHGKELSGVVESIKTQYDAERDSRRKRLLLGLVSCHMTGAQLKRRGWAVKKSLLRRSRRPMKVPSLPPNCKPLSADTREAIQMHYLDHCQPAGDRTCYDKTQKSHITVMVAVRGYSR